MARLLFQTDKMLCYSDNRFCLIGHKGNVIDHGVWRRYNGKIGLTFSNGLAVDDVDVIKAYEQYLARIVVDG